MEIGLGGGETVKCSDIFWGEGGGDSLFRVKNGVNVGPGLAQLVECLTHRYSESTSSNPGNLTSATVCGDRTGSTPAAKRSAHVAPEMDLGDCTLRLPPQKSK